MSSASRMDLMALWEPLARPAFAVLTAISVSHLLNDTIQSILPAIYPFLKSAFAMLLVAAGLLGIGSSVFHPESSRVAR